MCRSLFPCAFVCVFPVRLLRALESNQYNHITATYFLLAERMLRERQEKEQHSQTRSPSPSKAQFRYMHTCTYTNKRTQRFLELVRVQCCILSQLFFCPAENK